MGQFPEFLLSGEDGLLQPYLLARSERSAEDLRRARGDRQACNCTNRSWKHEGGRRRCSRSALGSEESADGLEAAGFPLIQALVHRVPPVSSWTITEYMLMIPGRSTNCQRGVG